MSKEWNKGDKIAVLDDAIEGIVIAVLITIIFNSFTLSALSIFELL